MDIHRRLDFAGFLLAGLMVILGVFAATASALRSNPPVSLVLVAPIGLMIAAIARWPFVMVHVGEWPTGHAIYSEREGGRVSITEKIGLTG
jgi:hypothetical protein